MTVRLGVRPRFLVASSLLILATVSASLWTLAALWRLSDEIGGTTRESEQTTLATARLAGALEREDDALLLVLAQGQAAGDALARERHLVNDSLAALEAQVQSAVERELATELRQGIDAYRAAADDVAGAASERDVLRRYHDEANPPLRRAVAITAAIRDRHFEATREVAASARERAIRAQRVVLVISLVAVGVALLVSWHLAGAVVEPLRQLTAGAKALRAGNFDARINLPPHDELGQLGVAFNQMAEDLGEFRRSNVQALLTAKAALEATLEALPEVVVLLDAHGRILSLNQAGRRMAQMLGRAHPQTVDDLGIEGLHSSVLDDARRERVPALEAADLGRTHRVDLGGRQRRLLPRVALVPGLSDDQEGVLLILYDVTDLVRLDEMRAELVAVASHELQTPLTTLRMTLLMLREAAEGLPARHQELVTTALVGIDQLTETVDEFLDLTRIEAGQLRLAVEPLDVGALIARVSLRHRARAQDAGIDLDVQVEPGLPPVRGDARRLAVVLDNLLVNACTYAKAGGSVAVAAHRLEGKEDVGRALRVTVTDTGPGVPPEFRARVFEKFFRVEHHLPLHTEGERGAGIGLYLCKEIVELHGGLIRCQAGPDGRGAVFVVDLPAAS